MLNASDTIAAIATPTGKGGVGIVRVSGPDTEHIMVGVCRRKLSPRLAEYCQFGGSDKTIIDSGIALYFPSPSSFTGESVLELHGHGGRVVMEMLLDRVCELGARLATPGEFSLRAFLNDKIDLSQAEAIADLIDSRTRRAARSAQRSLQGEFSTMIRQLSQAVVETRVWVEAAIDFPEEEIDFLSSDELADKIAQLSSKLQEVLARTTRGVLLNEGVTLAITGRPNVGKSSLLNCLTGEDTAIVTDVPGTTRDPLSVNLQIDGIPVNIIDTAGLRETTDMIEGMGIDRAHRTISMADIIVMVAQAPDGLTSQDHEILKQLPAGLPVICVMNKIDLCASRCDSTGDQALRTIELSALTGEGLDNFYSEVKKVLGVGDSLDDVFLARQRHLQSLWLCEQHLAAAVHSFEYAQAGELIAEDLRQAHRALGEIVGEFTTEDLLGEIFAGFCIGK